MVDRVSGKGDNKLRAWFRIEPEEIAKVWMSTDVRQVSLWRVKSQR